MRQIVLVAAFWMLAAAPGLADPGPDIVNRGKQATALVETTVVQGSCFCIEPSGLFVTAARVVEQPGQGGTVKLIVTSSQGHQQVVSATVIRVDKQSDLALLKTQIRGTYTALPPGDDIRLYGDQPVVAFGFPFGPDPAVNQFPGLSINQGHITTLRQANGRLDRIQVDTALDPGDSGGPILNERGEVVGVISKEFDDTTLNLAVPASHIIELLKDPILSFNPPSLTSTTIFEPQDFLIEVDALNASTNPLRVTVTLGTTAGDSHTYTAAAAGGNLYKVHALLATRVSTAYLNISATDGAGSTNYQVEDEPVGLNDTVINLSRVVEIDTAPQPQVLLDDGRTVPGTLAGIEKIPTTGAGTPASLDLSRFSKVVIHRAGAPPRQVDYVISVQQGGQEISRAQGSIPVTNGPGGAVASGPVSDSSGPGTPFPLPPGSASPIQVTVTTSSGPGSAGAGSGNIHFRRPVTYPVPKAMEVAVADLDGDGKLDILVCSEDNVSVLYGKGDGTFEQAVMFPLGTLATAVTAADFNGDGRLDLAVAEENGHTVAILLNQGGRHFGPPGTYPAGRRPYGICAGDFNGDGDGKADLAMSDNFGNRMVVLLNKGDGTFYAPDFYQGGRTPARVMCADLNGDGRLDLAMTNYLSNDLYVYLNDGTGKFHQDSTCSAGSNTTYVIADDFNHDGFLDLACTNNRGGSISVYFNNGHGKFEPQVVYAANSEPHQLQSADFNGDGWPDLACSNTAADHFTVIPNLGNGHFGDAITIPSGGNDTRNLAVGDFNGDGLPDVVVACTGSSVVAVHINDSPRARK